MSLSRPSKAQRDEWAELLGDEHRNARKWGYRALVIPLLLLTIAIPYVLLSGAGYVGGCPSNEEMTAFWAKPASEVSDSEREAAIREQLRCNDFEGLDRNAVMERLGEWTSVKEYPKTAAAAKGTYLVWSNGSDTKGIAITFTGPRGKAIKVDTYEP